jgi:hypothetical protein
MFPSVLPWVGCFTLLINVVLSWYKQDVPYFPIEMSKIANNYPQYYIFVSGMSITAYSISQLNCSMVPLLPYMISGCLLMLALLSDQNYWLIHVCFATSFFILACVFLIVEGIWLMYPCSTIMLVIFVAFEKSIGLILIVLYGKLQPQEDTYVIQFRQIKAIAQWLSIIGLMIMVSKR